MNAFVVNIVAISFIFGFLAWLFLRAFLQVLLLLFGYKKEVKNYPTAQKILRYYSLIFGILCGALVGLNLYVRYAP